MSQVLEIITSLGIDATVYYQFLIFFVAYMGMKHIVFKPYLTAYHERINRTVGGEELAKNLYEDAEEIEKQYSIEAKKLNEEVKSIFEVENQKANKEKASILEAARKEAESKVQQGRKALEDAVGEVRENMVSEIPAISQKIENKFMGSVK